MFPGSTDVLNLHCQTSVFFNGFLPFITAALIIVVIATAVLMPGIQVTIDNWIVVHDVSATPMSLVLSVRS